MSGDRPQLIIAGGGLSGALAALTLAERRPDISFLLVEQEQTFGGNHVWSFFDGDVDDSERGLVAPLVVRRWPDHEVRFPRRRRRIGLGYNSIRSDRLDRLVRGRLPATRYRLGQAIRAVGEGHVLLDGGERLHADAVIDARGPNGTSGLALGWQKFVGRTYRFAEGHGCERPVIMDATVDQDGGYRFLYSLPFSETELLVEDTYYSTTPGLDVPLLRERTDAYARRAVGKAGELLSEEQGVLPVLLDGKVEALWPAAEPRVPRLGLRGGFFHPTTGYSLPDAVANAALLAEQRDFRTAALHRLFADRAADLWRQRRFYQLLNRMLFRAARPSQRYRVLEHFYRLPAPLIARFYAGRLTALDKLRILSGRPPVPIGRALTAMRGRP